MFAPLCAALGFAGRRLIRGRWWTPVAVAALCTVVLALLAVPVYAKPGCAPDNPTVLDRNYPLGLWISLAHRVGVRAGLLRWSPRLATSSSG